MVEIIPSAKMRVLATGQLRSPGTCASCGNGTCVDGYVDPDIFFDYEGNIYICMNCVRQIIELVDGLLPAEATHLHELSQDLAKKLAEAESKLQAYGQFDSVISEFFGRSIANSSDAADLPSGEVKHEGPEGNGDAANAAGNGEPKSPKPVTKQGPVHPKRPSASNGPKLNI